VEIAHSWSECGNQQLSLGNNINRRSLSSVYHSYHHDNIVASDGFLGKVERGYNHPRALVKSGVVNAGIKGSFALSVAGFHSRHVPLISCIGFGSIILPSVLRISSCVLPTDACFRQGIFGILRRTQSGIRRGLSYTRLPDTYGGSNERSHYKESGEPRQPPVGIDLISCELMLFAVACLAGDLFLTLRFIKDDSAAFLMEAIGFVVLFLVGQASIFLCARGFMDSLDFDSSMALAGI